MIFWLLVFCKASDSNERFGQKHSDIFVFPWLLDLRNELDHFWRIDTRLWIVSALCRVQSCPFCYAKKLLIERIQSRLRGGSRNFSEGMRYSLGPFSRVGAECKTCHFCWGKWNFFVRGGCGRPHRTLPLPGSAPVIKDIIIDMDVCGLTADSKQFSKGDVTRQNELDLS
jgi:hypothetical protein